MTIALAVSTPEGIILASESRAIIASNKWFKDYTNKIYSDDFTVLEGDHPKIHKVGHYTLIYSGISNLNGWTSDQEIAKLHRMATVGTDFKILADGFYAKLRKTLKGYGFGFLLCGYDRGGNQLWAEGTSDSPLEVNGGPGTQPMYCLRAFGTVEAIAKLFKDEVIHYENMSLQDAFSFTMLSMSVGCKCLEWFDSLPAVSGGNIYLATVTPWGIAGYKFPPYDPSKPAPAMPWQIPNNATQPVRSHGIGGYIYSSLFRSGTQDATDYTEIAQGDSPVRVVKGGKVAAELWTSTRFGLAGGSGGAIVLRNVTVDDMRGYITAYHGQFGDGLLVNAENDNTTERDLILKGDAVRVKAREVSIDNPLGQVAMGVVGNFRVYGSYGGDIEPATNGDGDIGNSSKRWYQVRAINIQSGDLCFSETSCPICGEKFKNGDVIVLLCKTVHEDFGTMTIPMHDRCKDTPAMVTVEVPETETRYRFNPEIGDIEPYQVSKFVDREKETPQVKEGFMLDELTGQFTRKALVVPLAKEGYVGKRTETGVVKFYNESTGKEVPLRSIMEPVEVFPERLATRQEAVGMIMVKRRRPVMRCITINTGQAGL